MAFWRLTEERGLATLSGDDGAGTEDMSGGALHLDGECYLDEEVCHAVSGCLACRARRGNGLRRQGGHSKKRSVVILQVKYSFIFELVLH